MIKKIQNKKISRRKEIHFLRSSMKLLSVKQTMLNTLSFLVKNQLQFFPFCPIGRNHDKLHTYQSPKIKSRCNFHLLCFQHRHQSTHPYCCKYTCHRQNTIYNNLHSLPITITACLVIIRESSLLLPLEIKETFITHSHNKKENCPNNSLSSVSLIPFLPDHSAIMY